MMLGQRSRFLRSEILLLMAGAWVFAACNSNSVSGTQPKAANSTTAETKSATGSSSQGSTIAETKSATNSRPQGLIEAVTAHTR